MCAFARTLLRLLGRVPIALALLAALVLARPAAAQADSGFTVIVNAVDPVEVLSRDEISRLFLRKIAMWPYHAAVQPVDQGETSPVRRAFTRVIHRKDIPAVKRYWQEATFTGQAVPPIERDGDSAVVAFVGTTRGSIGYVAPTAPLGRRVRTVRIVY